MHEPIISRELWDQAYVDIESRKRSKKALKRKFSRGFRNALTAVGDCGICTAMQPKGQGKSNIICVRHTVNTAGIKVQDTIFGMTYAVVLYLA